MAIITGSTSGMGEAIARRFAKEGAAVVVNGTSEERGKRIEEEIRADGGRAAFYQADVSSAAEVEDGRGMLPLHWAAAFGRVGHGVVKRLINAYPQAVTCVSIDGDIPLHLAVANATIDGGDDGRSGSGSSSNDGKVDRNRLKIVELLMNDTVLKSSPFRDTSDVTSPILTANREKLTPLHVSSLFPVPEFA